MKKTKTFIETGDVLLMLAVNNLHRIHVFAFTFILLYVVMNTPNSVHFSHPQEPSKRYNIHE